MVSFSIGHWPHTISCYCFVATVSILHRYRDIITYFPKFKALTLVRDSEHICLDANIMHALALLLCINQHTEFQVPGFTILNILL